MNDGCQLATIYKIQECGLSYYIPKGEWINKGNSDFIVLGQLVAAEATS